MVALRRRNAAVLYKVEAVEGVEETLAEATDAVLVENLQISPDPQNTQTNEHTGSLDGFGQIVGGMKFGFQFDVYLKGSGAAGTAPQFGDLLRICGLAEQITAAAVPAAPEAAAAGSADTLTLAAGAAATVQLYRGMPIDLTVLPVGGARPFITDYTAAKLATLAETFSPPLGITTLYQIPINVLYKPASTSIPTATFALYIDGVKYTVLGVRGDWTLSLPAGGPGKLSFTFGGMFKDKTDVAVPALTLDGTRPPVWRGGKALFDRATAALATLTLASGNQLAFPPNPNSSEGFDPQVITARNMTGSADPQLTLVATRDILADMRAGTQKIIHAGLGSVVGNRVGITIPAALYTGAAPGDREGVATEETPFDATGQDAGLQICFF